MASMQAAENLDLQKRWRKPSRHHPAQRPSLSLPAGGKGEGGVKARSFGAAVASGILFLLAGLPLAQAKPQRIVSTNVCADQLALLLAPDRVVSVSFNAVDDAISNFAAEAKHI